MNPVDGDALVWCDRLFGTPCGKTAHGLVRHTRRYRVLAVIDSRHAGRDAGDVLDQRPCGIPVCATLASALEHARRVGDPRTLVMGVAPDGGRLSANDRAAVRAALRRGLGVDCGLHDYLSDDPELVDLAAATGARIRDIRRPPHTRELHAFTGQIERVGALRVAVLGTDSAVGKRTTTVLLAQALGAAGLRADWIGTGQTAWLQGVRFGVVMDSLPNDFVAGELEHAVLRAWQADRPDVLVIEGQGSLMNPAYPGGFEILAATRPHGVILQHAPARVEYDGFPGYPVHPLATQIQAIELISGRPVIAVALSHEGLSPEDARRACARVTAETGLVCCDPLARDLEPLVTTVRSLRERA